MKLRYTVPALADRVTSSITSPQGARRVHARIKTVTELLLLHPYIGRRTSDPAIRRITARPYPYLIFYEITATEIIIHAVRHAARDPSTMPGSA